MPPNAPALPARRQPDVPFTSRRWLPTIYFSPSKPTNAKEGTWIQTMPGKGWFLLLRLYS